MLKKNLISAALPFMRQLQERHGETIGLAVLDPLEHKGLIIESVQGLRHRFSFTLTPGTWFPLHTGAPAKAMLAFLPRPRQVQWLKHLEFTRFTPQTIVDSAAFERELSGIRSCGYALDRSEEIEGCYCVAAPVFDERRTPAAAIWLTGPSSRLTVADLQRCAPDVVQTAAKITSALLSGEQTADGSSFNPDFVPLVLRHIETHLSERVDWHQLAVSLGVSYSKLRHLFAEQVGSPPAQYHLAKRIEEAQRLLRETQLSIQSIAFKTGFTDPNHFSTIFARKTGCSPTRFRN